MCRGLQQRVSVTLAGAIGNTGVSDGQPNDAGYSKQGSMFFTSNLCQLMHAMHDTISEEDREF
jgi:hypothetical protein